MLRRFIRNAVEDALNQRAHGDVPFVHAEMIGAAGETRGGGGDNSASSSGGSHSHDAEVFTR